MRSQQHHRLLLVQGDPEHVHGHRRVRGLAVVDGVGPGFCLESALRLLHKGDRDLGQGLRVDINVPVLVSKMFVSILNVLSGLSGRVHHLHAAVCGPHHLPHQRTDAQRLF